MKRRAPLLRKTPLKRTQSMSHSGELTGGLPLHRTEIKRPRRRDTGPTAAVRQAVYARDGGCLRCAAPMPTRMQIHHRIPRGMGGSRDHRLNQPANLVTLCEPCHAYVEGHPELAYATGWKIRGRAVDPAEVLVSTHFGWVRLDNDAHAFTPTPADMRLHLDRTQP